MSHTDRRGFTLIELVIVIGIIGLIVVMSITSYFSYRKSISLSLAVDSLQSAVKSVQQQARSGKGMVNGKSVPLCYGIVLKDGQPVRFVTAEYKDASNSVNQSEFPCNLSTEKVGKSVNLMEGVQVAIESDRSVYAIPPRGEFMTSSGQSSISFALQFGADTSKAIPITMRLPFGILEKL